MAAQDRRSPAIDLWCSPASCTGLQLESQTPCDVGWDGMRSPLAIAHSVRKFSLPRDAGIAGLAGCLHCSWEWSLLPSPGRVNSIFVAVPSF